MLAKRFLITFWLCLVAAVALPSQEGAAHAGEHGIVALIDDCRAPRLVRWCLLLAPLID